MSNTVITNYTDLNGPSTKSDSSVVVIVNKDGSLSVDQSLLGTLMGTDGAQAAGISVVRVGHEGRPDDATDSETEDDKVPHVTLSVDSYYDEPNSIIKYDSGAEMLQSLRIETRENSLVGFQNDHCYTTLTSPSQSLPKSSDSFSGYDEPQIEISHTPPPKPVPSSKKITILEQQIIPKGKKILLNPTEAPIILKGNDVLNKPLSVLSKVKKSADSDKSLNIQKKSEESSESSSISSSGDSIPDRDSDSDYKDSRDRSGSVRVKKSKIKPRILKSTTPKTTREPKIISRLKANKTLLKRDIKEKVQLKIASEKKQQDVDLESLIPTSEISIPTSTLPTDLKANSKQTPKAVKREKKTPAHVTALLSDMTSLFSTPDVIRRVSTDNKGPTRPEKEVPQNENKKATPIAIKQDGNEGKITESKQVESIEKLKLLQTHKTYAKQKDKIINPAEKVKGFELIPQLDDASLAQILQDATSAASNPVKVQPSITTSNTMNSPGLTGPLSPTLDLLGGLQPEEEGLTEDLLMHVAQLVESSENLQEVIDKQVLGKVDTPKAPIQSAFQHAAAAGTAFTQANQKVVKNIAVRKDPIEIVRRDGRVITLPPIEAPATRSSKRKSQMETSSNADTISTPAPAPVPVPVVLDPPVVSVSKQFMNKKISTKKQEQVVQQPLPPPVVDKTSAESQESWNSEDDPYRLWCICKQPHNNRFMICCDSCEDWFHGKCVNITKAMGQQMEEQGIEWRCPNCIKKTKPQSKTPAKVLTQKKTEVEVIPSTPTSVSKIPTLIPTLSSKTGCIVCKKAARASSIYCSDACILKHAQDSLGNQSPAKADGAQSKAQDKKSESRVIVYERKSGRLLAGPNAPTAENLKAWLQKNPTFEVVRPGTLSTIKPNVNKRKSLTESHKIQTTLNFERIPKKSDQQTPAKIHQSEVRDKTPKVLQSPKEEKSLKITPSPREDRLSKILLSPKEEMKVMAKTPVTPKSQPLQLIDTPKASTSFAKTSSEPRKLVRTSSRSQSTYDKAPVVSPSTSRRKDAHSNKKMESTEPIRENVRKALQEQMTSRMAEHDGPKFSEEEIQQFVYDTEDELYELFSRDVGMKYKAKYRSLMFNIKDRKNLSLWQKICDRSITPKQLVRLSPEELASQELAEWRDQEAKHQLELIKKSEIDLLAASKTYVLKTHKGEEVMETKESVSTELDPNVPVEDLVTALNDQTVGDVPPPEDIVLGIPSVEKESTDKKRSSKKRGREYGGSGHKKSKKESKRSSERRKSKSSRRDSEKEKEPRDDKSTRRSRRRSSRTKSVSNKDALSSEPKEISDSADRSRQRSRSRTKIKKRSKSREFSRSASKGRSRSRSRDSYRTRSSRSKHSSSTEDKLKHRSRSQDLVSSKNKNDSTDSDSIERPKSAMLKEAHPEYDPHEPMITSAFSEEDLRKSREDVYEDSYKNDIDDYGNTDYDSGKAFSLNTNIVIPTSSSAKPDRISVEAESDQEPSSTVEHSSAIIWNGCINMVDVARFYVAAHEVSGIAADLEDDLSTELDIVGRINPDTVWDYIGKMKRASNKDIVILKLQAANDEEKMQYIALYSYLSSRNRLGVVKVSNTTSVKDFYIVPVPANTTLPPVLLPLDGPGLGEVKTHLLIAIVIRQRKKRLAPHIPKEIIPAKVARESRKRSYTPPVVGKSSYTPPTSPKRRPLPLPTYTSPALSTSVKDKIAASLACADDEEAYSPGSSSSGGSAPLATPANPPSNTLRCKMEELNRQIEEQKQQIMKMAQADSSVGEDEAYSPSRPMTPPAVNPLADISLPSNLQEILATIKQRSENTSADVDMRTMPLPP
ncbi:death-inducer obliterator 1 [Plodia interpunctella]|uniref:death-inducer obliterator 1 n=1 Tax=Plodia interpunctella TaxID=58824 RepID=UPI00236831A1|nr:death-inducer obliterator 1 [Plodia interpunctella]